MKQLTLIAIIFLSCTIVVKDCRRLDQSSVGGVDSVYAVHGWDHIENTAHAIRIQEGLLDDIKEKALWRFPNQEGYIFFMVTDWNGSNYIDTMRVMCKLKIMPSGDVDTLRLAWNFDKYNVKWVIIEEK